MEFHILVTDNGPQYTADEFAKFARTYNFFHITSSPYFPQSNGLAERAVQTVKNILRDSRDTYPSLHIYRRPHSLGAISLQHNCLWAENLDQIFLSYWNNLYQPGHIWLNLASKMLNLNESRRATLKNVIKRNHFHFFQRDLRYGSPQTEAILFEEKWQDK